MKLVEKKYIERETENTEIKEWVVKLETKDGAIAATLHLPADQFGVFESVKRKAVFDISIVQSQTNIDEYYPKKEKKPTGTKKQ